NQTKEQKESVRKRESIAEAHVLGTEPVFLNLGFYDGGEKSFVKDKQKILAQFKRIRPDIVFLPQENDTHPTHRFSRRLAIEAMARLKKKPEIWDYETPWGLFTHKGFNAIVEFCGNTLEKKNLSIKKHLSQIKRTRFDVAAKNIARFRAIVIGEQILSDFGRSSPKTLPFMELFKIEPSHETYKKAFS
ncbi:MAG: PIG-L family deacetylase, partial [Candidatus ainarchaeum sp.]|nr:PIG-L family deacetylase [Candidatus ainarchaeum sp.]